MFYDTQPQLQAQNIKIIDEQDQEINSPTPIPKQRSMTKKISSKKQFKRTSTIIDDEEFPGWAFEDSRITRIIFEKYRIIELARFWFILASMILTLLQFEYSFATYLTNRMDEQLQILLYLVFYMSIIIVLLTIIAYLIELEYRKKAKTVSQRASLWQTDLKWGLLTELIVIIPTSTPFTSNYYVTFEQRGTFELRFYFVNEILTFIMLFRLYVILKIGLKFQTYYSNRIGRLCRLYQAEFGTHLMLKLCIRRYPFSSLTWLFIIGFVQYTYQLEISERPLLRYFDSLDQYNINKSLWETMITIATVGYGDFFPYTDLGRIVMTLGLFYGVSITSLFTAILYNMLSPTKEEYQCWALLDKTKVTNNIKKASTRIFYFLNRIWQEKQMAKKLNVAENTYSALLNIENYLSQVGMLKKMHRDIDGEAFMDMVHRKFDDANSRFKELKYSISQMAEQQHTIYKYLSSEKGQEQQEVSDNFTANWRPLSNGKQSNQFKTTAEKLSKDDDFFHNLNDLDPDPYLMSFND